MSDLRYGYDPEPPPLPWAYRVAQGAREVIRQVTRRLIFLGIACGILYGLLYTMPDFEHLRTMPLARLTLGDIFGLLVWIFWAFSFGIFAFKLIGAAFGPDDSLD